MAIKHLPVVGRRGKLRVVIVASETAYRAAVEDLLRESVAFKLLRAVSPPVSNDVLHLIERSSPRLVLLEASAASEAATATLRSTLRSAALVVLEGPRTADELLTLLERGVTGFVSLSMPAIEIEVLLTALALGHVLVPRDLLLTALKRGTVPAQGRELPPSSLDRLTSRERTILDLLVSGMSNKAMAAQLQVSVATVKAHVHSVLDKLGVRHRGQAAALWRDHQAKVREESARTPGSRSQG